ncbi:hypothetical protein NQ315_002358, partial [Exocentrus adspersus]
PPSEKKFANFHVSGSRYFGIPTLDPFFIKEMVLKSEASQTVAVEQTYQNIRMHGMTNSNTEQNFKIDLVENCAWTMDVKTPVLILEGDYKISGTLLMFPLNGFGKCNITMCKSPVEFDINGFKMAASAQEDTYCSVVVNESIFPDNMVNTHKSTCEKYAVKGKTYLKLTNYTMDIKLDKITMDFENIFPGNAQISAEILKTLNDNSDAVFKDIKSGFEQVFSSIHLTMANKVFSKVPLNEIFLD